MSQEIELLKYKSIIDLVDEWAYISKYIVDNKIMRIQTLKKRRFLIAIIMVVSLLGSASYSVAMPIIMASMDSSECMLESTPCDMCCLMSQPDPQADLIVSLLSLLDSAPVSAPDSLPLPFYHPPG